MEWVLWVPIHHWQLTVCCPKALLCSIVPPGWQLALLHVMRQDVRWTGCNRVLGSSRGSQASSAPLDLPGQEAEVVLIPSSPVANGYGIHPAGPAAPGSHPSCVSAPQLGRVGAVLLHSSRTPGRGSGWKNAGRLL